jgi:hypothetical protein
MLTVSGRMIIDPKSTQYIQWTENGTSFVVSNIGEFSRVILGSHFKHSNVSFFVFVLTFVLDSHANMYIRSSHPSSVN